MTFTVLKDNLGYEYSIAWWWNTTLQSWLQVFRQEMKEAEEYCWIILEAGSRENGALCHTYHNL